MTVCAWCGKPAEKKSHSSPDSHILCSVRCTYDFHNAKTRAARLKAWEDAPLFECEECHGKYKPEYKAGWKQRKRCSACKLTETEASRRYRERMKAERKSYDTPVNPRPIRPCRSLEKRQFKSTLCTGFIVNSGNWWFCKECDREYIAREGTWFDDYPVETIRPSDMGLIPY